jgi:hypothetical protein
MSTGSKAIDFYKRMERWDDKVESRMVELAGQGDQGSEEFLGLLKAQALSSSGKQAYLTFDMKLTQMVISEQK